MQDHNVSEGVSGSIDDGFDTQGPVTGAAVLLLADSFDIGRTEYRELAAARNGRSGGRGLSCCNQSVELPSMIPSPP
jgi:hypothetical protein